MNTGFALDLGDRCSHEFDVLQHDVVCALGNDEAIPAMLVGLRPLIDE